jgi:hypothetical protein
MALSAKASNVWPPGNGEIGILLDGRDHGIFDVFLSSAEPSKGTRKGVRSVQEAIRSAKMGKASLEQDCLCHE